MAVLIPWVVWLHCQRLAKHIHAPYGRPAVADTYPICRAADGSILRKATRLKRRWLNEMVRRFPGMTEKESFAGEDLRQATLDGHSFKMCDFRGADLRGASLRGTHFAGCDLRGADFRWADLTGAEFGYVITHDPNYGLTDVTGANWEGSCLKRVKVERVIGWPDD